MRKILMFFVMVLVTASVALAQTRQVQGTVTNAAGGPIQNSIWLTLKRAADDRLLIGGPYF